MRSARLAARRIAEGIDLELEGEETKLLILVPYEEVLKTPFLAGMPERGIYTVFSEARIRDCRHEKTGEGRHLEIEIGAIEERVTRTAIAVPPNVRVEARVQNASACRIAREPGVLALTVTHSDKAARIVLTWPTEIRTDR